MSTATQYSTVSASVPAEELAASGSLPTTETLVDADVAIDASADATTSAVDDADLELVMAQCGVPMEIACELLNQANGDIVEAIAYHFNPALAASEAHKEAQEWALVSADEGDDTADEATRKAREVQAKLAELRDITTAKNAMLDEQMRARKTEAVQEEER